MTLREGPALLGAGTKLHVEPDVTKETWLRRNHARVTGFIAVASFLAIWEIVARMRIMPPLFLPGPTDVVKAGIEAAQHPQLWTDLSTSGMELAIGYTVAAVTAIPLGLLTGWYPRWRHATDPFINFLYATPRVVLVPLFIIWFGIGPESKVALVFLGAFFSIVINTNAGVRSLDPNLLKVARSFGASDLRIFRTIALPGSVPFILTGLRLGIGHALIAVVVGELIGARAGIGLRIAIAGATFQTAKVFALVTVVAMTGLVMTAALARAEAHFDRWRVRDRE
jgi:ABC-type nitrate/sulfonate/bicarbonate transport system permease component